MFWTKIMYENLRGSNEIVQKKSLRKKTTKKQKTNKRKKTMPDTILLLTTLLC
jgi:hypothetical protein